MGYIKKKVRESKKKMKTDKKSVRQAAWQKRGCDGDRQTGR